VSLLSTGNALPAPTLIGASGILPPSEVIDDDGLGTFDPLNDGIDFWEALEGMLVTGGSDLVFDFATTQDRIELYDGIGAAGSQVSDVDRDGKLDLTLSFTKGGGSVTLLGVQDIGSLDIYATPHGLSGDYREAGYGLVQDYMLATLMDWTSDLVIM
jgi:hypothetical protein